MLSNTTVGNWTMASVQHNGGWYLGGQAGDTSLGKGCIKSWLGAGSPYLAWDVISVNFGLHDLNDLGKQVPVAAYQANLVAIFAELKKTGAKLIFTTTTPVPLGDGGGKRTEDNVRKYNAAALAALSADIASGRVVVNDLHGDVVRRCGANYTATGRCELQIPNNVHYEYEGRQYCALSVTRAVLQALYGFGTPLTPAPPAPPPKQCTPTGQACGATNASAPACCGSDTCDTPPDCGGPSPPPPSWQCYRPPPPPLPGCAKEGAACKVDADCCPDPWCHETSCESHNGKGQCHRIMPPSPPAPPPAPV